MRLHQFTLQAKVYQHCLFLWFFTDPGYYQTYFNCYKSKLLSMASHYCLIMRIEIVILYFIGHLCFFFSDFFIFSWVEHIFSLLICMNLCKLRKLVLACHLFWLYFLLAQIFVVHNFIDLSMFFCSYSVYCELPGKTFH